MSELSKNKDYNFDICFLTMTELNTDARTLNFIRTLIKFDKHIAVVSIGNGNGLDFKDTEKIQTFFIEIPSGLRAYKKWLIFNKKTKLIFDKLKAKIYWASDLFALKSARDLSISYNAKLYFDSREIYSALASLHDKPLKQKIQNYFEKKWVKSVHKIIVTGKLDAEYLKEYYSLGIPFFVIKNFPPYKKTINSDKLRENFNIPENATILLYQGMIMQGRGILSVIQSLPHLSDCYFCLFGDGDYQNIAMNKAIELSVADRVIFCGKVPYYNLHEWTCSADIGLALIEPISFSYELALPNKLFEYTMAQIPSVVSDLPAMKEVINNYNIGKLVSRDIKTKDIVNAVIEIKKNKNNYIENCKIASKIFSFESQENQIKNIFEIR